MMTLAEIRENAHSWTMGQMGQIHLSGADCAAFLQNLSPIQVPTSGSFASYAWLDKKGHIQHSAWLLNLNEGGFLILCPFEDAVSLLQYLDQMIFGEEVDLELWEYPTLLCQGAKAAKPNARHVYEFDLCGNGGYLALDPTELAPENSSLSEAFSADQSQPLPWAYKGDLFNDTRFMALKQQKKCYPGQEIVARIRDRGKAPKQTLFLQGEGLELFLAEQKAQVRERLDTRSAWVQCSAKVLAEFTSTHAMVDLKSLNKRPFLSPGKIQEAENLYHSGIEAFHHSNTAQAEALFVQSMSANPYHTLSLEALALCHEKQGNWDLAIKFQNQLVEMEPLSVLPLSNLSRLYMLKGWTTEAESFQSKAALLTSQLQSKSDLSEENWAAIQSQLKQQNEAQNRKMELFQSALEIDPEDDIALFGLGKIYADQGLHAQALELLQRLVQLKPDYSAAWAQLCRAALKQLPPAESTTLLNQGIEVARQKGDLMPLKLMENLLRTQSPA